MQVPSYDHEFYTSESINSLLTQLEVDFSQESNSIEQIEKIHYDAVNAFEYLVVGVGVDYRIINTNESSHQTADAYSPLQVRFFELIQAIEKKIEEIVMGCDNPALRKHNEEFKRLVRKKNILYEHRLVKELYIETCKTNDKVGDIMKNKGEGKEKERDKDSKRRSKKRKWYKKDHRKNGYSDGHDSNYGEDERYDDEEEYKYKKRKKKRKKKRD